MVKTKVITCAGYYGTGSSAITDLLGEFSNVYFVGDYEFRFVQDPGGIADLEYNIVDNYHRHNSGYALKRFKKNIDFLCKNKFNKTYEKTFHGRVWQITREWAYLLDVLFPLVPHRLKPIQVEVWIHENQEVAQRVGVIGELWCVLYITIGITHASIDFHPLGNLL